MVIIKKRLRSKPAIEVNNFLGAFVSERLASLALINWPIFFTLYKELSYGKDFNLSD